MPPKKKRTSSLKANSVSIAIGNNISEDIVNYQKQVKLLQKEIETYKEKIIILQNENDILKSHINDSLKIRLSNETSNIGLLGRNSLKVSNENLSSSVLGTKTSKGCSCKGNCANKICGCVRKGISCQIFCKCNELQCHNQESNKENIEQIELNPEGQKVLEKLGHLSLNQESLHASEKKSKRGIFSPFIDSNTANKDGLHSASPITLETRRRLFTQDSDELVDINDSLDEKNILHTEPRNFELGENSNNINNSQIKNQNHLSVTDINKSVSYSPTVSRKKSKSVSPDHHVYQRKYEKDSTKIISKTRSISPNDNLNDLRNIKEKQSTYNQMEYHPKFLCVDNPISDNQTSNKTDEKEIKVSPSCILKNSILIQSTANGAIHSTDNKDILDMSLNPMMPKRQLRRSPVTVAGTAIVLPENKRFSPPKKELAVAEVNWVQHKSELVMCTICKRKFFPHRIEKHKISCIGI